mgnify:CR=1 FL=1
MENSLSIFVKEMRKQFGLTQVDFLKRLMLLR